MRYRFDTTLARSTGTLLAWLVLSCLAVVVPVSALVVWTDPGSPRSLSGRLLAVGRTSAETLRLGAPSGAPLRMVLSLFLGLVALLCVSTLVGMITTGLGERLTDLRRGRSAVLEQEHAVVLGWSDQVFTVVGELAAARAGRHCVIAVLADRDVAEMEETLTASLGRGSGVRLVCRSGSPTAVDRLALVTPRAASSVLVLPSDAYDADSEVVRTLLALRAVLGEDPGPPVVAAVRDRRHLPAARLAAGVRGTIVETDATAARLLVHSARRSGVGEVLRDLLDFAGAEFHFVDLPPDDRRADGREACAERCFGDVLLGFDRASVVGLAPPDGPPVLNPPARTVVGPRDRLVVIARDCAAGAPADCRAHVDLTAVAVAQPEYAGPVRVLLLGWNRRAPLLVRALRHSVVPGSVLDVVVDDVVADGVTADDLVVGGIVAGGVQRTSAPDHAGSAPDHTGSPEAAARLAVSCRSGDLLHPESLEDLDLFGYDSVIVLGADAGAGPGHPDDRVLVTLLTLRSMELRSGRALPVVAELGDRRNRALAALGPASDIVVQGELTGLLMAQIAHNPHLAAVFSELFAAHGTSIQLRPAGHYVVPGSEASFATVVAAALDRGECAIGYRHLGPDAEADGPGTAGPDIGKPGTGGLGTGGPGIGKPGAGGPGAGGPGAGRRHELRLNPAKSERRVWGVRDEVVVLATETAAPGAPHGPAGTAPVVPHAREGGGPPPGRPFGTPRRQEGTE